MDSSNLLFLVLILIILLLIVVIAFMLVFFALIIKGNFNPLSVLEKFKKGDSEEALPSSKIFKRPFANKRKKIRHQFCTLHPEIRSAGVCAICEEAFCETCITDFEKLLFCPEHYTTFTEHNWIELASVKTGPNISENAFFLYEFKSELWSKKIPTYLVTHYRINVDDDSIESDVKLFVREEDKQDLSKKLDQFQTKTESANI